MTPLRLRPPEELAPIRSRYVKLLIHAATSGEPERPSPMDAGLVLCDVLAEEAGRSGDDFARLDSQSVVSDAAGHRRPFYPALLVYARALAGRLRGDVEEPERAALGRWVERLEAQDDAGDLLFAGSGPIMSMEIEQATRLSWSWLARWCAGPLLGLDPPPRPIVWEAIASDDGSYFTADDTVNPEPRWYHELVLLHAITSYAALSGDALALAAAKKGAMYHHRETQPDHATSQPWAIHAFLMDPETIPTADLLLLAAGVNQPGGLGAVPRMLLADAAVALSIA